MLTGWRRRESRTTIKAAHALSARECATFAPAGGGRLRARYSDWLNHRQTWTGSILGKKSPRISDATWRPSAAGRNERGCVFIAITTIGWDRCMPTGSSLMPGGRLVAPRSTSISRRLHGLGTDDVSRWVPGFWSFWLSSQLRSGSPVESRSRKPAFRGPR